MISIKMLVFSYTLQLVVLKVCTKFQITGCNIPGESLTDISLCIPLE